MNSTNDHGLLQEIEEDLARQRIEALWKRFAPLIIGGAVLIVLGTAAFTGWRSYKTQSEQKATSDLIYLLDNQTDKKDEQITALTDFAKTHKGDTQAVLARFQAASIALKDDKTDKAVEIYNTIAADSSVDTFYRQLADLFVVQAQLDTGDAATLEARLKPLMANDCAWRFSATEYAGHLAVRGGDKVKAKELFLKLKNMENVPPSMAQRASDMLVLLNEGS